ncbi:MAG: hypothetical protein Q9M89_04450 [Persephonella sp.]|nr:hypothetical protein [Persephonella sp.]
MSIHKDDSLFNKLTDYLKNGKTYYTITLGLANLIANFRFNGIYEAKPLDEANEIITVVPEKNVGSIEITEGKKYFKEKLPVNRNLTRGFKVRRCSYGGAGKNIKRKISKQL